MKRPAELIGFQSFDAAEYDLLHLREVRLDADGADDFEDLTDSAARNTVLTRASSRSVLEGRLSAKSDCFLTNDHLQARLMHGYAN